MNCPEFDTLMMFLDGELQGEELEAVSEHVLSCSNCRKIIDSQRKLETSWRESFDFPDDAQFRRLEQSIYNRINRHSWWKALIPAAAGIIAVLLGVKLIINNQPTPDRISELSRGIRGEEYAMDDRTSIEEQTECLYESVTEHVADAWDSDTVVMQSDMQVTTEEGSGEASIRPETEIVSPGQGVQMEPEQEEDILVGGFAAVTSSPVQESDGQSPASDSEFAAGSSGGGSHGSYGYLVSEESEEYEVPDEAAAGIETAEDTGCETQMDESLDITLLLDMDTTGLETVQTVQTGSTISDDTEENRASVQSGELYSRLNELPADYMDSPGEEVYVELAFDAYGIPDSCTALILDSLCAGWNDYIPFYYRDTVLVVPLSSVQSLFIDESAVTEECMEE